MFSKRKWGWYLVLWQWPLFSKGPRYKLKLLYFKHGGAISMQRHFKRSEEWKMLRGRGMMKGLRDGVVIPTAYFSKPTIGYWPVEQKEWHRFESDIPTLILETQRGICMESDIERI